MFTASRQAQEITKFITVFGHWSRLATGIAVHYSINLRFFLLPDFVLHKRSAEPSLTNRRCARRPAPRPARIASPCGTVFEQPRPPLRCRCGGFDPIEIRSVVAPTVTVRHPFAHISEVVHALVLIVAQFTSTKYPIRTLTPRWSAAAIVITAQS